MQTNYNISLIVQKLWPILPLHTKNKGQSQIHMVTNFGTLLPTERAPLTKSEVSISSSSKVVA